MRWLYHINEQLRITDLVAVFKSHYVPGFSSNGDSHEPRSCIYVLNGELDVERDDLTYHMREGDMVFHMPYEYHKYIADPKSSCDVLIISYYSEGPVSDFFDHKLFSLLPEQKNMINEMLGFLKQNLIGEISTSHFLTPHSDAYLALLALRIETLFMSIYYAYYHDNNAEYKAITKKAVKYMHLHLNDQISIEDIADHCGCSVSKLKIVFAEEYRLGIHKYFITLKMCRAIQMLKEGMNVSQISDRLGFVSQSYFSTCFKRETGFTPSEYKRKFL